MVQCLKEKSFVCPELPHHALSPCLTATSQFCPCPEGTQLSLPRSVLWIEASTSAAKARGIKVQLSGHCKAIVMLKPGAYFCCKYSHVERSSQADPIITSGPLLSLMPQQPIGLEFLWVIQDPI